VHGASTYTHTQARVRAQVKGFARRIHPEALSALAELFLVNGDMSAWLYTGSQVRERR